MFDVGWLLRTVRGLSHRSRSRELTQIPLVRNYAADENRNSKKHPVRLNYERSREPCSGALLGAAPRPRPLNTTSRQWPCSWAAGMCGVEPAPAPRALPLLDVRWSHAPAPCLDLGWHANLRNTTHNDPVSLNCLDPGRYGRNIPAIWHGRRKSR